MYATTQLTRSYFDRELIGSTKTLAVSCYHNLQQMTWQSAKALTVCPKNRAYTLLKTCSILQAYDTNKHNNKKNKKKYSSWNRDTLLAKDFIVGMRVCIFFSLLHPTDADIRFPCQIRKKIITCRVSINKLINGLHFNMQLAFVGR